MFTGIITNLGKIIRKEGSIFTFNTNPVFCKKLKNGTSIAVNGTCLTVLKKSTSSFSVEVIPETLNKTIFEYIEIGDLVNLELPLTPKGFLSGHIVQGHIDTVAKLAGIEKQENSHIFKFTIPLHLSRFIAEKGSIAVNGISLTVIKAEKNYFTVGIIPYTWKNTMLHTIKPGDFINIEVDILAKYVERLCGRDYDPNI